MSSNSLRVVLAVTCVVAAATPVSAPAPARDYPVGFTVADRAKLRRAFPDGVCDHNRPGPSERPPSGTWIDYTIAN